MRHHLLLPKNVLELRDNCSDKKEAFHAFVNTETLQINQSFQKQRRISLTTILNYTSSVDLDWAAPVFFIQQWQLKCFPFSQAVKMMVMVVLVFALTRIPLFVVYLVAIALGAALPFQKKLTLSVSWVYCTSTVFNPLIYAAMNEK